MTKEKILKFAKSSIFDNAEYIGKWKGYDVWEPGFDDDELRCIIIQKKITNFTNINTTPPFIRPRVKMCPSRPKRNTDLYIAKL